MTDGLVATRVKVKHVLTFLQDGFEQALSTNTLETSGEIERTGVFMLFGLVWRVDSPEEEVLIGDQPMNVAGEASHMYGMSLFQNWNSW